MSNIDFAQTITAEAKLKARQAAFPQSVKASCAAHISEVLDLVTLANLQSAALLDELDDKQTAAFSQARGWIKGTRALCREVIAKGAMSGTAEPVAWPPAPEPVRQLAEQF